MTPWIVCGTSTQGNPDREYPDHFQPVNTKYSRPGVLQLPIGNTMPRIANAGPVVDAWYDTESDGSGTSTWDVCRRCLKQIEKKGLTAFADKLEPYNGDPMGTEIEDVECHPDYTEDCGQYECDCCGKVLTLRDD